MAIKGLVTEDLRGTTTGKILEVGPLVNGERKIIETDKPAAGANTISMEFYYPASSGLVYTRTIGTLQAGTYTAASVNNVATQAYKKNGGTVSLPFTLAASDTLEVTITRTTSSTISILTLTT